MAHQSPSDEQSNDRSNNSINVDQQYKNWDIVKSTQVLPYRFVYLVTSLYLLAYILSMEYLTAVKN